MGPSRGRRRPAVSDRRRRFAEANTHRLQPPASRARRRNSTAWTPTLPMRAHGRERAPPGSRRTHCGPCIPSDPSAPPKTGSLRSGPRSTARASGRRERDGPRASYALTTGLRCAVVFRDQRKRAGSCRGPRSGPCLKCSSPGIEHARTADAIRGPREDRYSSRLFFDLACGRRKGFRSPTLTLLQLRLDRLQSIDLVRLLHCGDLANHPVESGLVQLSLRIGLLGLRLGSVKVADHFGDRVDIAGVDLGFVLLSAPRPHRALDARASGQNVERSPCGVGIGDLTHSNARDLRRRDAQRKLVLRETDDKQLKLKPGDLLLLDRDDLPDPVRGIDDELVELEALTLARALQSLRCGGFLRDDRLLDLDDGRGGLCRRRLARRSDMSGVSGTWL